MTDVLDLRPPKKVDHEAVRTLHVRGIMILEAAFEERAVRSLRRVLKAVSSSFGAVVAAGEDDPSGEAWASFDDLAAINAGWSEEVSEELLPALADSYAAGAQSAGLAVAGSPEIPEFVSDQAVDWLQSAENRLARVSDEVWSTVREELTAGMLEGESIDQLKRRVRQSMFASEKRARTIARTEVIGATNAGSYFEAKALGVSTKTWLATTDRRTRPTHATAEGQEVGMDEPFQVGEALLRFPHDPTGPAKETVNCRCTMLYDDHGACMCVPGWAQTESGESLAAAANSNCACSENIADRQLALNTSKALTRKEAAALDTYWGDPENGSELINARLRAKSQRGIQDKVELLDSALSKNRLAEKATVYRGISGDYAHSLKVGDRVRDNAFLSTSTDRAVAERFAQSLLPGEKVGKVIRLELPKGFEALPVPSGLNEYLLPRSIGYQVKSVTDTEVVLGL